jgi:glycosyltransferase involved in cell wall biosynthesis
VVTRPPSPKRRGSAARKQASAPVRFPEDDRPPLKIVFLSATGSIGGAERALLDLLASLRAAVPGWELHLVVCGAGPLAERAAALGATVHALPLPAALQRIGDAGGGSPVALLGRLLAASPSGALWTGRLRRLLRRLGPSVVHSNGFKMHVAGALALSAGARLVWHAHDFAGSRPLMALLLRRPRVLRRVSAAVAVSHRVAEDLKRVCGDALPVHVVYNAVDVQRFAPQGPRAPLAELAGMKPEPPGCVAVGLVATMGRWKGHQLFLDAVARLPRHLPVRAYVVGGSIYATEGSEVDPDELRRLAARLGIGARVGFTGFVEDAAAAIRALDVVVHASTQPEPFGLVIAEGMACGRAVVSTAAGGAAEIVRDGVDALAVKPNDPNALAEAIRRLVVDSALRARLGAAGREHAERDFDRARLADEITPIYRAVAAAG